MGLRFYNTLSRSRENFAPADGTTARVYSCGPTVYSRQHIGNMRAVVFVDVLKRTLRYAGYDVEDVINITDVGHLASDEDEGEDKIARAARESGKDHAEVARHFEELYWGNLEQLNVIPPKYHPRATEHVEEQINFIKALEARGLTYATDDGVYFDTIKLTEYGQLSRQPLEEKEAGARVAIRGGKRNPRDFALWKYILGEHERHAMRWESPWGTGFPGWHIECSAMGKKYLGSTIDIHTGGIEHVPVHHENEIAQNGGSGLLHVRFWLHNEHLLLAGGKMSKSLGNVLTLDDLESRGVHPLAFRYWLLTAHYRSSVNFTWDAVEAAQQALIRLYRALFRHSIGRPTRKDAFVCSAVNARGGTVPPREEGLSLLATTRAIVQRHCTRFLEHINDDLDTPGALATLWNLVKDDAIELKAKRETVFDFDRVFGLGFVERASEIAALAENSTIPIEELPEEVRTLILEREQARREQDWTHADRLRTEIRKHRIIVEDAAPGAAVKIRRTRGQADSASP